MSFSIPPILAADISTQVWADQVVYAYKTYFEADRNDTPVQNIYNTIIDEEGGVELRLLSGHYDDDEESGGTLQFKITIDGITWISDEVAGGWGTPMFCGALSHLSDNLDLSEDLAIMQVGGRCDAGHLSYGNHGGGDPPAGIPSGSYIRCHEAKVEIRFTNVAGTNDALAWALSYALLEAV